MMTSFLYAMLSLRVLESINFIIELVYTCECVNHAICGEKGIICLLYIPFMQRDSTVALHWAEVIAKKYE